MIEEQLGLNVGDFVRRLHDSLGAAANKTTSTQLGLFIDTAFFAGLMREEGQFAAFAIALVDDEMLSGHGVNRRDWNPMRFDTPKPFDPGVIAKLAPAIDRRQTIIAVSQQDAGLVISGIIRTNTGRYRFARGESSSCNGIAYDPVILTVIDIGTITVDIGRRRFATISRGRILQDGVGVFEGGRIFSELDRYATASGLDAELYTRLLKRAIHSLADRGHGGIVLLVQEGDLSSLDIRYCANNGSSAIQDAIRFVEGDPLGATIDIGSVSVLGAPEPEPAQVEIERQRRRAIREHEFEQDVASFAADLASVDGALVLRRDLSIVGFGAHILCAEPKEVPIRLARDTDPKGFADVSTSPLLRLGTRHNSTARFCYNHADTMAFVVSQDGIVSCLTRYAGNAVTLWRPVAMERHWRC
ncbi:putative sensor domain DACNV-containing protein [Sorangium sp. So ce302]|uniref:putative sensor domain DACNV-containing protein n=1 Tax=Sorangium sp. So ce302 TaxID=3133297 RepID=UPI003F601740